MLATSTAMAMWTLPSIWSTITETRISTFFLGKGDGSFQKPFVFNASSDDCCFYFDGMGDFNNDGKLDFVLPDSSNDQVFLGD